MQQYSTIKKEVEGLSDCAYQLTTTSLIEDACSLCQAMGNLLELWLEHTRLAQREGGVALKTTSMGFISHAGKGSYVLSLLAWVKFQF